MNTHEQVERTIKAMQPLPHVVQELFAIAGEPEANFNRATFLIKQEPVLSSKVLQLANSPFYGFHSKVNSIDQALRLLGFNCVKNLALSISLVNNTKNSNRLDINQYSQLWTRSLATAILATKLAKEKTKINGDEIFTIGMLFNIGKIIMIDCFEDDYPSVPRQSLEENKPVYLVETERYDINFKDVRLKFIEYLGLPDKFYQILACQNQDNGNHYSEIYRLLCLSDCIAKTFGLGDDGDNVVDKKDFSLIETFNMSCHDLTELYQSVITDIKVTSDIIGFQNSALPDEARDCARKSLQFKQHNDIYQVILKLLSIRLGYALLAEESSLAEEDVPHTFMIDSGLSESDKQILANKGVLVINLEKWLSELDQTDYINIPEALDELRKELDTHAKDR